MGQKCVEEKNNERKAISELLDCLNVKGTIVTTDTMGTQTATVKKIRQKQAEYVLVLKMNQGNLLEDVRLYFTDREFLKKSEYKKTIEKARGRIEKREYWQTDDLSWLSQKKEWTGLRTQYDDWRRWKRAEGRTVFYKQSAIRNRGSSQNGAGSLDGRELSLASGCDIP